MALLPLRAVKITSEAPLLAGYDGEQEGRCIGAKASKREPTRIFACSCAGGAGDNRHAFETMRDIYSSCEGRAPGKALPKAELAVSDISEEALARLAAMSALLYALGGRKKESFQVDADGLPNNAKGATSATHAAKRGQKRLDANPQACAPNAMEAVTLAHHAYVSPFLLPGHQMKLLDIISFLASAQFSPCSFISSAEAAAWQRLRVAFKHRASNHAGVDELDDCLPASGSDKEEWMAALREKGAQGRLDGGQMRIPGAFCSAPAAKKGDKIMEKVKNSGSLQRRQLPPRLRE